MKGPYERLKYDLRRLWECPVCKRRERTSGGITSRLCQCQAKQADGQPVVMKLIEEGTQRLAPMHNAENSEVGGQKSDAPTSDL